MAGKKGRRAFGYIRKRTYQSGLVRYEASFVGPDLATHYCPTGPWSQRIDAEAWLSKESRLIELHNLGERVWTPPKTRTIKPVTLDEYAKKWNKERKLAARTRVEYERYREQHLGDLGKVIVGNLTAQAVRSWLAALGTEYERRNAQVYAWLHAVLNTAVGDELLQSNPCTIKGGMQAKVKREPVILNVKELERLADAIHHRLRLAVLTMAWCTCRWGEVAALRRKDVQGAVLHVRTGVVRTGGEYDDSEGTKTRRGRTVAIPPHILPDVKKHLEMYVGPEPDALLFVGSLSGTFMHEKVFRDSYFDPAAEKIGKPKLVPHDLRKFAGTHTASVGATIRENMNRMGHTTMQASMLYQQAVSGRDAEIAVELSKLTGWTPQEGDEAAGGQGQHGAE